MARSHDRFKHTSRQLTTSLRTGTTQVVPVRATESCKCQTSIRVMPTAHYTTRRDNFRQENRVMCGGSTTRRDTTRQKSDLVVSDLTMLDICDKARFLSCRVASCRRPPHITRFSCRGFASLTLARFCGTHWHDWSRASAQTSRKRA